MGKSRSIPVMCVLFVSGCTGLEPGAIGVGMTAVQQGVTYVSGVDSYSFQPARFQAVIAAAEAAGDKLDLEVYARREISPGRIEIRFRFDEDDRLTVEIEEQTEVVTLVRTNVKKKTRQGMATLFMRGLTHELREADGYEGEWKDQPDLMGG